jgi:ParB-like chromosome segregation protein Spo0J
VVDGFHRNRVGKECAEVKARVLGYLPITRINAERAEIKDRMAATIRHNRARGVHGIESMATIVAKMYFNGWSNKRICEELGMSKDEVLRLKQFTGLGNLFENRDFSRAWEL